MKDMDAYLTEWLDYHLGAMSIENIYLYDNSKQFYLKNWYDNTRNHTLYHRVHVIHWADLLSPQRGAYTDCVTRFGRNVARTSYQRMSIKIKNGEKELLREQIKRTLDNTREGNDYLAFIDGDEFLVPKGNYSNIHHVVQDYRESVCVHLSVL